MGNRVSVNSQLVDKPETDADDRVCNGDSDGGQKGVGLQSQLRISGLVVLDSPAFRDFPVCGSRSLRVCYTDGLAQEGFWTHLESQFLGEAEGR